MYNFRDDLPKKAKHDHRLYLSAHARNISLQQFNSDYGKNGI